MNKPFPFNMMCMMPGSKNCKGAFHLKNWPFPSMLFLLCSRKGDELMKSLTLQQRFVLTAIARGERTFQAIVQSSGGMDPLELQAILDDLIFSGRIQWMRGE